tara:strand:+ start:1358 stop:1552 length:195 start_codon:yes stop_codon:yes gene_type:complete
MFLVDYVWDSMVEFLYEVLISNGGIMKKVIITLEFEKEEVDQEDVIQYLQELIEQNCLYYEEVE